jgi:galactofuranosylgalactofuranosylrhamnosyl-N-acetylglucosaminyl-diphospho-decaprenol beta-1,5/1,6-galactofuranosyltransferase
MSQHTTMPVLQSITWPDTSFCTEDSLFFTELKQGYFSINRQSIQLSRFGSVSFLSYFNAFHVSRWKAINNQVQPKFRLKGSGNLLIKWELHDSSSKVILLGEVECQLNPGQWTDIETPKIAPDANGFLAPRIFATSESCEIKEGQFTSSVPAVRKVRLGMVITHFKRNKQVLGAIQRLTPLLTHEAHKDRLSLTIVDNSQDLPPSEHENLRIIPNHNLGGSGGFARGLLEYDLTGRYTHCLFMDDDASCSTESILRTLAVLEMANDDATAIAGSMLREDEPTVMHEDGAIFNGGCHAIHHGMDMSDPSDFLRTDAQQKIDYGAWWFFAFPIQHTKHYPFPFFVRGDDISFGLANDFSIITLNGICSWQDSFEDKASPLTNYLDTRNHLVHLLTGHVEQGKRLVPGTLKMFVTRRLESLLYESAEAALIAVDDVLQGPDFWRQNMDMSERRAFIGNLTKIERMGPIDANELAAATAKSNPRKLAKRIAYHLTMKGILIPRTLMRKRTASTPKSFTADRYALFRFQRVIYLSPRSKLGFITQLDKTRTVRLMLKNQQAVAKLLRNFESLSERYRHGYQEMTSKQFWLDTYGITQREP